MIKPLILITNDDGIHAAGLKHLWHAVRYLADVLLCAPEGEKSGSSLSTTSTRPLQLTAREWEGTKVWSLNGTPADCVKIALSVLLEKRPALILSGINRGANSGRTLLYSGTVGGVIEGTLRGIPGIAFSFSDYFYPPLSSVQAPLVALVRHFLEHPLPTGTLLNATFPLECEKGMKGMRMARQGKGYWMENPERRIHPEGEPYYWLGGKWGHHEEEPDSDVALLEQGFATVVPIQIDQLTDQRLFDQHKPAIEKLFLAPLPGISG